MVVVGGAGTLFGAVIGSAIIIFTRNIISLYTSRWPTVMGLIFVVTILFAPNGLVGGARRLVERIMQARRGPAQPTEEVISQPTETDETAATVPQKKTLQKVS